MVDYNDVSEYLKTRVYYNLADRDIPIFDNEYALMYLMFNDIIQLDEETGTFSVINN